MVTKFGTPLAFCENAPSTTLRVVPLPRFAGEDHQRSFNELRPIRASTKLMIQKRMTTWLSVQPIISK